MGLEVDVTGSCLIGITATFRNVGDIPTMVVSGELSRPFDPPFSLMWSGALEPGATWEATYLGQLFGTPGEPVTSGVGLFFAGDYTLTVETLDHGTFTDTLTLTIDDPECEWPPVTEPPTTTDPPPTTAPPTTTTSIPPPPTGVPTGTAGLAATGFNLWPELAAGLLLLAVGAAILLTDRRMRKHEV